MPSGLSEEDSLSLPKTSSNQINLSTISNYATATVSKVKDELGDFLQKRGLVNNFSSLTNKDTLSIANGVATVKNAATGAAEAFLGAGSSDSTPASIFDSDDTSNRTIEQKVTITQRPATDSGLNTLVFEVMPSISERNSASYDSFAPLHAGGEILKFRNTTARSWSISGKLIARTVEEASLNLAYINMIRTWNKPFVGSGTADTKYTSSAYLGAPPPILTLSAYGEQMIGPIQCVLESYSWDWPNDVDYLQAIARDANGKFVKVPFPVIVSVSLDLKESWSPAEQSGFDLNSFKNGDMSGAYKPVTVAIPINTSSNGNQTTSADTSAEVRQETTTVSQSEINKAESVARTLTKSEIYGSSSMGGSKSSSSVR